ncbi:rhombotarget A [Acinetobacter rudis]|uniref:rhombotarget A n=1 Tax=Acinetobacter rudis TaxID=632955 RepID=UPI0028107E14|nr:rhombotarget A [Acinetobacter rudis]MDQ8951416.1 rhombotarget A [Acinetobacter rudis]
MLKQGVLLGLFIVATQSYAAPIYVTTTEDIVADDQQCSLREAIEYVNLGMPKEGYKGCGGEDAESTIYLKPKTEYKLNSQIKIRKNLVIRTLIEQGANETRPEKYNASIKMLGKDRLFWIERYSETEKPKTDKPGPIHVFLQQLNLKGCNENLCQNQGGLIYNKEKLNIIVSQLQGGKAQQGGAIYNAGEYDKDDKQASLEMLDVMFKGNKAEQGAVIYSEMLQYIGARLVLRDNITTDARAANIEVKKPFSKEQLEDIGTNLGRGISNSTIFNNKGYVLRVIDGMSINNSTIILNDKGLIIDSPFKKAYVVNSILLNNGSQDCQVNNATDANNISNNLYGVGCAGTMGQVVPKDTVLLAGKDIDAECDISSQGLLCPFNSTSNDSAWGFFKPRLLNSYRFITDSPIVNRGPEHNSQLLSCAVDDQRGKPRPAEPQLCDRGAIELYVTPNASPQIGQNISYGQVAKMKLDEQLKDGELVSPDVCVRLFGQQPNGQTWQAGCLKIVQSNSTPNSKGTLTASQDGVFTYVPNGNWHGMDEFTSLVVTSTSRFTDSTNPYVSIPTRIVQEPNEGIENKKAGGGATGLWGLLGLVSVIALRHGRQKWGSKT